MRTKTGKKRGGLTPAQCVIKATELIAEHGICLFLIDVAHMSDEDSDGRTAQLRYLVDFTKEATKVFADEFPVNELAVYNREEKGFQEYLGDASWAGIVDPETITRIVAFKDSNYPALKLHYGVAADGWSEGIELVK